MKRNDEILEKTIKTALLLGTINLISSPLYFMSGSASSLFAFAINAFSIFQFHELGKSRRPVSNFVTKGWTLFSSWSSNISPRTIIETNEIDNVCRNIVNGGAAIVDEAEMVVGKYCGIKPNRY